MTMTDERPTWDQTWLDIADVVARRSRCSRAQVGAVIVSAAQRVCATGYNGPAATWAHDGQCNMWCPRARGEAPLDAMYDSCPSIHAEGNALMYVDRSSVEGGTIYITSPPCMQCAKLISNSGIQRVVCYVNDYDLHRNPQQAIDYLISCGINSTMISR